MTIGMKVSEHFLATIIDHENIFAAKGMEGVYISNRDADVRVSLIYANASCRRHHFASKHFHPGAGLLY